MKISVCGSAFAIQLSLDRTTIVTLLLALIEIRLNLRLVIVIVISTTPLKTVKSVHIKIRLDILVYIKCSLIYLRCPQTLIRIMICGLACGIEARLICWKYLLKD